MYKEIFDLEGFHAVVCGAATGMGREFALALASRGVEVVVADIQTEKGKETVDQISQSGGKAHFIQMNAGDHASVEAMGREAQKRMGTIDIAVNSVGITGKQEDGESNADLFERVVGINLTGMFNCCEVFGEIMIPQKHGKIINICSLNATIVPPKAYPGRNGEYGLMAYTAAKAGLRQMSKAMAALWAEYGVTVNCISPGFVNTPLAAAPNSDPVIRKYRIDATPIHKIAEPSDIAGAVLYLASRASDFITGEDMVIDGGYSLY